ncbi:S-formylglutathione hydrolase [[Limnothrix rosea] IAM M-220]|uniref:S-formylglutathione hydrolase n=1 Tax=[Limnothrix rosea] IAM M-220 TaxID=454133 RepID=UPI000962E7C4|nr:S-formylglutathione hydrolase [[Limnothrix rosea] IAM M-220]OKH17611.1 S-formylglutathione hydrolase [[Limnothrix rosea] IAM M-220]
MTKLVLQKEILCFGGRVRYYSHQSIACRGEMNFTVFMPPQTKNEAVPVLYYLSGLTCTEENFTTKAGAQQYAAQHGLMLVAPDTSPRNTGIPDEDKDWDLGSGAGFYVDATAKPWSKHYRMYSYVTKELPELIEENFAVTDKRGIFGHSMGGHGALICALRKPDFYHSVSAFAPVVAPMQCAWGEKAFTAYLGEDQKTWRKYDATQIITKRQFNGKILIDQGKADVFLEKQLLTNQFAIACEKVGQPLRLRYQEGYDHSYFFIATFMADHIEHHAQNLL